MKQKLLAAIGLVLVMQLAGARLVTAQSPYNLDTSHSELRPLIERFVADRGSLVRFHNVPNAPARTAALKRFYEETQTQLVALNFDKLSYDGQVDYLLLKNHLAYEQRTLATNAAAFAPERRTEKLAIGFETLRHKTLQVMAGDEFVLHRRAREIRIVAAHAHQVSRLCAITKRALAS